MKIEPRGKYPGVKVHLDPDDVKTVIQGAKGKSQEDGLLAVRFVLKLAKKIQALQDEKPTLLEARTEAEIRAELEEERDKSIEKLKAMDAGKDWKKVGK